MYSVLYRLVLQTNIVFLYSTPKPVDTDDES